MADAENARDVDAYIRDLSPNYTGRVNGAPFSNSVAEEAAAVKSTAESIPDYRREWQWLDGTDDRIIGQYRLTATHNHEFFGAPPTGNRLEIHGVVIARHDGEKLLALDLFADMGEVTRQLAGQQRAPGTVSAGPARMVPEADRARLEAAGERLMRKVYESRSAGDLDGELSCYANPMLDHYFGKATAVDPVQARPLFAAIYAAYPGIRQPILELISIGARTIATWHLTDERAGKQVSQHGCTVIEHDGERITRVWTYYPDVLEVFPQIEAAVAG
jgi:predicted ester cyclase